MTAVRAPRASTTILQWMDTQSAADKLGVPVSEIRRRVVIGQLQSRVTPAGQSQVRSLAKPSVVPPPLDDEGFENEDEAFDPTPLDRAANWVARHEVITWGAVLVLVAVLAAMGNQSRHSASAAHRSSGSDFPMPSGNFSGNWEQKERSSATTAPATQATSRPVEGIDDTWIRDRKESGSSMLNEWKDLNQLELVELFLNQLLPEPMVGEAYGQMARHLSRYMPEGFHLGAEPTMPVFLVEENASGWEMRYQITEYHLLPPVLATWRYSQPATAATPLVELASSLVLATPPIVNGNGGGTSNGSGGGTTPSPTVGVVGPGVETAPEPNSLLLLSLGSGPILLSRVRSAAPRAAVD